MAIRIRLYSDSGQRGPQVGLALRKADVGTRILRALQDPTLMVKGGFNIHDLVKLDSGELPLSKVAALYDGDELETSIQRRIDEISQETEELKALRELLHSGAWRGANGGPGSNPSREATLRGAWRETVTGARKSLASQPPTLQKSGAMGGTDCATILTAHNWEKSDQAQDHAIWTLSKIPGHTVHVNVKTQAWEHKKGQRTIGQSERGDEPQVSGALLNSHLMTQFHR